MGSPWNPFGFQLHKLFCFFALTFLFKFHGCLSLNLEGLALLVFRENVERDPYGVFSNWSPDDSDPCTWSGVHCDDGKVQILDLSGLSLEGTLSPELGQLSHLKSLILFNNQFTGVIPKEFGELTLLELLELSSNNLSGMIPAEIGRMVSLKRLLLCNNKFHGSIPLELGNLNLLSEVQFDQNLTFTVDSGVRCLHRRFGHCIWQKSLNQLKEDSFMIRIKRKFQRPVNVLPWFFRKSSSNVCGERYCENLSSSAEPYLEQNAEDLVKFVRRKLLQETSNLASETFRGKLPESTPVPPLRSSGSFPAIPKPRIPPPSLPVPSVNQSPIHTDSPITPAPPPKDEHKYTGRIIAGISAASLLSFAAVMLLLAYRRRDKKAVSPWKSGISGQLQKAFVTGVPKLNRSELESACEDFSNIIGTLGHLTLYKGTLSSGVEIAVASTSIKELKNWSKSSEMAYRKKIDSLSRVNHKNFVNLLGFCEEDEPFSRMMVFEYAPSGSLFEHLHVKEIEHLDWNARMRIVMGIAYCLQYVHELNPPVPIDVLKSNSILLTDDYAAKVADVGSSIDAKSEISEDGELEHSDLPAIVDIESNVYCFGLLLLEIISGKLLYSEKQGSLLTWASEYLNDKGNIDYLTDPTLKTFKNNELEIVCEVIKECIHQDPRQRPTMRETVSKLREVIPISPDAATPRLSPLWWAELEILSVEAT